MNARRPRLSDQVTAELERRILAGELEPGGLLPAEPELGAELEVSRSVIRDAIRTLAARGLVEVRQGSGTRVSPPGAAAPASSEPGESVWERRP